MTPRRRPLLRFVYGGNAPPLRSPPSQRPSRARLRGRASPPAPAGRSSPARKERVHLSTPPPPASHHARSNEEHGRGDDSTMCWGGPRGQTAAHARAMMMPGPTPTGHIRVWPTCGGDALEERELAEVDLGRRARVGRVGTHVGDRLEDAAVRRDPRRDCLHLPPPPPAT
jgi:hypothetical protein